MGREEKVEVISRGLDLELEEGKGKGARRRNQNLFIPLIGQRREREGNNQSDQLQGKASSRIFEFLSGNKYHWNFWPPGVGR